MPSCTGCRSLPSLQNWAAEVSQLGSFQAPYSEDRAALNLGGLPVPCLVVGNKQDLVGKHRCRHAPPRREQVRARSLGLGPVHLYVELGWVGRDSSQHQVYSRDGVLGLVRKLSGENSPVERAGDSWMAASFVKRAVCSC